MIGIGMYIVFGEYGSLEGKWRIETRIEVNKLEKEALYRKDYHKRHRMTKMV